ncbi:acetyl-CoA carboxylase biotin carboxyl carrier protein subunit [Polaribacter vadi]|uniref:biotin/lipoyl-containing protein n=1 Tax=Polaribacter TaxID=52959 RepID=UPI001C091523|nr:MULTISPECIES: biotin/lipoyl-containing protein [Polaribacter]MBU3012541.1 acetyl-CoA carboxylase biotin carboxyl carrier protein subunit [Polaribacter vadi]MDO6742358.1 biotin/lipoyl-containing protein [Polaribacter sp. 1_MG-2023]
MNSLKKVLNWLKSNKKDSRRLVKNEVFEIKYNTELTTDVLVPNIQNKSFKISKWFVNVGDLIKEGQIICELENNSMSIEFESLTTGKLVYITKPKNKLQPNDLICKIEELQ